MAMPRARGGTSPSTRSSPMWISPDVGRSSPAIMRSRVVFPEPEEPSKTRNSPSRIDRSTPSTAWRSPKCFRRLRISIPATVGALAPGLPPVGRGIRRLRQVYRWAVNDAVRVLGHLEVLHHRRGRAGRGPGPPPSAATATHRREDCATENRNPHAQSDVHRFSFTQKVRRPTVPHASAIPGTSPRRGPGATPRRSTGPLPARRLRSRRRPGTARAATPRILRARGRRRPPARAAPASWSTRSRPASCRACAAAFSPPTHRGRRGVPGRSRLGGPARRPSRLILAERPPPTSTNLHPPPPTSHRWPFSDAGLDWIPRPVRSPIAPLEGRDVQRDRRQVVQQDRPRSERAHRRDRFHVALAGVADLDLAGLLARLRREVAEVVVLGLVTEHAAQERDRPSRAAAPAA